MHKSEEPFAEYLESQGKSWAYEPIRFQLKNTTYKPDFYCPEDDIFYEVVGTRQAISVKKQKIKEFIKTYPHINFKIVNPFGEKYIPKKINQKNPKRIVYPIKMGLEIYEELEDYANNHGNQTIASVVRYAIMVFLNKYK